MRDRVSSGSPYESRYGFSRGIRVGHRVEIAGTAPIPQDGSAPPESAYDQMVLCGEIATVALESLGASVEDVVRTRMFVTDAAIADDVGRGHQVVFGAARPVATMVVVAGLLDPRWLVEIEVEAQVG
ncbi:MAG: RidA family protein [Acidimicrobiia bacterium]|nr:RidA family protein [Acidimicrobiia bacterium]MDH4306816.1 RidA family protein [Acidimicrobiia bacterium]MDH5293988.1 RidA family protein [Acidimicrobiia bacterium]